MSTHHAMLQESSMERLEDGLMSPKAPACATDTGESAAHLSLQGSKVHSVSGSAAMTLARTAYRLITWASCTCSTMAMLLNARRPMCR